MTIQDQDFEPTLLDVLQMAGETQGSAKRGPIPATVETFDKDTQMATVVPAVQVRMPSGEAIEHPKVKVRVLFPSGGGTSIFWPLDEGDTVWLIAPEIDTSLWLQNGSRREAPPTTRTYSLNDAVAIPGGPPLTESLSSYAVADSAVVVASQQIWLGSSGVGGAGPAHPVALGDYVDTNLAAITTWYSALVAWASFNGLTVPPVLGTFVTTSSLIVKADG